MHPSISQKNLFSFEFQAPLLDFDEGNFEDKIKVLFDSKLMI